MNLARQRHAFHGEGEAPAEPKIVTYHALRFQIRCRIVFQGCWRSAAYANRLGTVANDESGSKTFYEFRTYAVDVTLCRGGR